jgi:hypothetical protein
MAKQAKGNRSSASSSHQDAFPTIVMSEVVWLRLADTHMLLYHHSVTDDPFKILNSSIL